MSITNVERSFGELLAAFGDLVVARTRGAPVDAAGGSTRTLARRYRARRRAFDRALDAVAASRPERVAVRTTMREPSRTCARRCPGSTSSNRRPAPDRPKAARPTRIRPSPGRERPSTGATGRRPSRCGSAGRRSIGRRSSAASPPRTTRTRAGPCSRRSRRSGGSSTAMAATAARIGGCSGRAPRAGPSTARRSRRTRSPSGLPAGSLEGMLHEILASWRSVVGPGADRAVGLLVRGWGRGSTARPARAGRPAAGGQRRLPGLPRGGSARPRDLVRHPAAARPSAGPGRVHAGDGRMGGGPAAERSLDAAPAVGLRDLRGREPRQPPRAAPRERPRAAHGRHQDASCLSRLSRGERRLSRGHGRRPRLGRRRTGVAAPLAGRGRRTARGAPQPLRRGHARHLLGALRDRAPPPPRAASERRLDRGDRRRPGRRAASRVVVVGHPRPAHRRARLSRQLRAVGDHGGRGPGTDRRGPRAVVRGRSGLVSVRGGRPVRAGIVSATGGAAGVLPRRPTHRRTAARRPARAG